jgi:hypothetical protein
MYRNNSRSHVRYADGCTHRNRGWPGCSPGVAVSSMRRRTRNSRSVVRASARVQWRTSWILRTPSACRPCSVSTGPRFTSTSQRSSSCSGDIRRVYNIPKYPTALIISCNRGVRALSYLGDEEPIGVQRATPSQLDRRLHDVAHEELIRRPAPEKWSIAEIVAHLADAELAAWP